MISKKMENMVANSSAIRAMFEEGNRLAKIYGSENVFDFPVHTASGNHVQGCVQIGTWNLFHI